MADSFVSRFGCYTIIWDTTRRATASIRGSIVARATDAASIGGSVDIREALRSTNRGLH